MLGLAEYDNVNFSLKKNLESNSTMLIYCKYTTTFFVLTDLSLEQHNKVHCNEQYHKKVGFHLNSHIYMSVLNIAREISLVPIEISLVYWQYTAMIFLTLQR